jgi:hypothetical protein
VLLSAVKVHFPLWSPAGDMQGEALGFVKKVSHHLEHLAGAACCYRGFGGLSCHDSFADCPTRPLGENKLVSNDLKVVDLKVVTV